jgi:hypothetical protein
MVAQNLRSFNIWYLENASCAACVADRLQRTGNATNRHDVDSTLADAPSASTKLGAASARTLARCRISRQCPSRAGRQFKFLVLRNRLEASRNTHEPNLFRGDQLDELLLQVRQDFLGRIRAEAFPSVVENFLQRRGSLFKELAHAN